MNLWYWKPIGFLFLILSFLIAFSGGLYAHVDNPLPISANVEGAVEMLSGPKGGLYTTHLLVAFVFLATGAYLLSWARCEHFSDFETGRVYSKPSPLLNESYTGGVAGLNSKDKFKSIKTEGGGRK